MKKFTKLIAVLAVIAMMFGFSLKNIGMKNAAAEAEEAFPAVTEEDIASQAAAKEVIFTEEKTTSTEDEIVSTEEITTSTEEDIISADMAEDIGPQDAEEAIIPQAEEAPEAAGGETALPDHSEEIAPQGDAEEIIPQDAEEEIIPQAAGEDPEAAGEEIVPQDAEEEIVPQADEETPETAGEEIAPQDASEEIIPQDAGDHSSEVPQAPAEEAVPEDESETEQPEFPGEEDEAAEVWNEEDLVVMEDGDAGYISEEIAGQFDNPEYNEQADFIGTAEIRLVNEGMLHYGDEIILKAEVRDVNLSYRLVWEASDHDERGWFTVGSGESYRFILDQDTAEREYRVAIIAMD